MEGEDGRMKKIGGFRLWQLAMADEAIG